VLEREKEVADLECRHRAVIGQLEQRVAHLQGRLAKETAACRELEHRCADARGARNVPIRTMVRTERGPCAEKRASCL
jgi:hypothetical protein